MDSSRTTDQPDGPRRLEGHREIRALAHPARLAIIDALASGDELTATDCAELTGLSPSATAYHLKSLHRYGFVEPAPARDDGRQRPWRAADRRAVLDLDTSTPAASTASATVALAHFDRTRAVGEAFIEGEHDEPEGWRDVATLATSDLWLTVDEVRAVAAALGAALAPYRDRTLADRPDGSRRVRTMTVVVPHHRRS